MEYNTILLLIFKYLFLLILFLNVHRGIQDQRQISYYLPLRSGQFSSVTHLCPTLCDPMNHSMPGLPVHHQLPEFTQTHAH